eukprot:TRINITY_DN3714_c0_g1_i1.p1 TRINITY_DN3714_c0_g1~~TRINITY_DN3714_c0_g1_i1.p1  ORF type:complete len:619 (+),score=99.00 TRINITY_DN3714_c0_g1_i1:123-1979(+)
MGNAVNQCNNSAVAFGKCQRACTHCGGIADILAPPGNLKLCSWVEEEVHQPGNDPMIGVDYGFLGMGATSATTTTTATSSGARPLYEPGSLVLVHGLGGDGRPATATPAATFSDVYDLDAQPLGRGSYGEVTGATHRRTGARRAVKTVGKANLKRYVTNVSSFVRREVDILRRLDHPNIVRLYEAFEDESTIYLVLELCEGGDLLERVAVARERLPEKEAAILVAQMLGSVQHLYLRGIVHRDLKPENFLFTRREPEREPLPPEVAPIKLIDFGLSRRLSFEVGMRMTPKIGTTEYMAPEAFAGRVNAVLADRTDMWSIGVILHVIFIGHFPSPRLSEQTTEEYLSLRCWSRISATGRDLLGQLLRQEPAHRPTVTAALKHPWLAAAAKWSSAELATGIPSAVRSLATMSDLRRLALAAVAREVDDCDVASVRKLFQTLELECDGALTRPALEQVAWLPGAVGATATELAHAFDSIDSDGSQTIDWTELLACALGAVADGCPKADAADEPEECVSLGLQDTPVLREDACWRAFDLLSLGSGAVTGMSLAQLFDQPHVLSAKSHGHTQPVATVVGSVSSVEFSDVSTLKVRRVDDIDRFMPGDAQGSVGQAAFARLVKG